MTADGEQCTRLARLHAIRRFPAEVAPAFCTRMFVEELNSSSPACPLHQSLAGQTMPALAYPPPPTFTLYPTRRPMLWISRRRRLRPRDHDASDSPALTFLHLAAAINPVDTRQTAAERHMHCTGGPRRSSKIDAGMAMAPAGMHGARLQLTAPVGPRKARSQRTNCATDVKWRRRKN